MSKFLNGAWIEIYNNDKLLGDGKVFEGFKFDFSDLTPISKESKFEGDIILKQVMDNSVVFINQYSKKEFSVELNDTQMVDTKKDAAIKIKLIGVRFEADQDVWITDGAA